MSPTGGWRRWIDWELIPFPMEFIHKQMMEVIPVKSNLLRLRRPFTCSLSYLFIITTDMFGYQSDPIEKIQDCALTSCLEIHQSRRGSAKITPGPWGREILLQNYKLCVWKSNRAHRCAQYARNSLRSTKKHLEINLHKNRNQKWISTSKKAIFR